MGISLLLYGALGLSTPGLAAGDGVARGGEIGTPEPAAEGSNSSNSKGAWRQLSLPASLARGVNRVFAAHDGYLYVGGTEGVFRALVSSLLANPSDSSLWQDLSATWPKSRGAALVVTYFAEGPSGQIFAGAGIDPVNVYCFVCTVAKLDPSTLTWGQSNHFQPGYEIRGIDFDSTGAIWVAAQQRGIFKSTNGGASFGLVVADPYKAFGQTTGWIYGMSIINNKVYWGGEGALNSTSLSFQSNSVETAGAGYGLNQYHVAGNGTQSTPATEIYSVGRQDANGSVVQHYTRGTWSDVVFEPTLYWQVHVIVKGAGEHEYYYAGKHGTSGGVAGTVDGVSWLLQNDGLPPGEQQNVNWLTISPESNTLFVTFDAGSPYAGEVWMR
jgi:hypothetical protein